MRRLQPNLTHIAGEDNPHNLLSLGFCAEICSVHRTRIPHKKTGSAFLGLEIEVRL